MQFCGTQILFVLTLQSTYIKLLKHHTHGWTPHTIFLSRPQTTAAIRPWAHKPCIVGYPSIGSLGCRDQAVSQVVWAAGIRQSVRQSGLQESGSQSGSLGCRNQAVRQADWAAGIRQSIRQPWLQESGSQSGSLGCRNQAI